MELINSYSYRVLSYAVENLEESDTMSLLEVYGGCVSFEAKGWNLNMQTVFGKYIYGNRWRTSLRPK